MDRANLPISELIKLLVYSGAFAMTMLGGLLTYTWWTNPFRTKPIPKFDDFKAELKTLSQAEGQVKRTPGSSDVYNVIWKPCQDDDCPFNGVSAIPNVIQGNLFQAILKLDQFVAEIGAHPDSTFDAEFIRPHYNKAAEKWDPTTQSFMEVFCRCTCEPNCLYLQRQIAL